VDATFLPLSASHLDCVIAMMAQLYAHGVGEFDSGRARRATERLLAEPEFGGVWMIVAGGQPVGYVALVLGFSLEFGGRFGLLDELFVAETWRGLGLGRQALEFAAAQCRARQWSALRLEVARKNERAQALYRRSGFASRDCDLMTWWM
jgi:GNAT superfamily N-acetyltransferase